MIFGTNRFEYYIRFIKELVKDCKMKQKRVEEVIEDKRAAEAEELRQLRNLKRNLESEIVFDMSEDLLNILMTYNVEDL